MKVPWLSAPGHSAGLPALAVGGGALPQGARRPHGRDGALLRAVHGRLRVAGPDPVEAQAIRVVNETLAELRPMARRLTGSSLCSVRPFTSRVISVHYAAYLCRYVLTLQL